MPFRGVARPAIVLLGVVVVLGTFVYGPARRHFVTPDQTVSIRSAAGLDELWRSSKVHGRIAVLFTRHLYPQVPGTSFPEADYLETAMQEGIVRERFHVVPDRVWSEVVLENVAGRDYVVRPEATETGYLILDKGGRIHILPLSRFVPGREKALVVLEPEMWTEKERSNIKHLMSLGLLTSDLLAVVSAGK